MCHGRVPRPRRRTDNAWARINQMYCVILQHYYAIEYAEICPECPKTIPHEEEVSYMHRIQAAAWVWKCDYCPNNLYTCKPALHCNECAETLLRRAGLIREENQEQRQQLRGPRSTTTRWLKRDSVASSKEKERSTKTGRPNPDVR